MLCMNVCGREHGMSQAGTHLLYYTCILNIIHIHPSEQNINKVLHHHVLVHMYLDVHCINIESDIIIMVMHAHAAIYIY